METKCLGKLPRQLFTPGKCKLFQGQTSIRRTIATPEAERVEDTRLSRTTGNVEQHGSHTLPYLLPRFAPCFPIERRLGKGAIGQWERCGRRRDHDGIRVSGIDSDTAQVMFGQAFVGALPGQSAIIAFLVAFSRSEEAIARPRVQAVWCIGMHPHGSGIDWSIGDAILAMRPAIQAADQCSSLHGDED